MLFTLAAPLLECWIHCIKKMARRKEMPPLLHHAANPRSSTFLFLGNYTAVLWLCCRMLFAGGETPGVRKLACAFMNCPFICHN
jgi:hypothetical protein